MTGDLNLFTENVYYPMLVSKETVPPKSTIRKGLLTRRRGRVGRMFNAYVNLCVKSNER